MPAGVGVGQLRALVRETRSLEQRSRPIAVSGPGAAELAARLVAGGDPGAVRVGSGDDAAASVVLLAASPGPAERQAMRRAARAGTALVVVRLGGYDGSAPYALASDVIDAPRGDLPPDALVDALAAALPGDVAVALAARLPVLRGAVSRRLIARTALANAAIGASPWMRRAHLPLMTAAQGRMLLDLGVVEGATLPRDPQRLAAVAGLPLGGALVAGLGLRGIYRRLPVRGPLVAALVAYAGTRALGELRARIAS